MSNPEYHTFHKGQEQIRFNVQTFEISRSSGLDPVFPETISSDDGSELCTDPQLPGSLCLTLTDACNLRCVYCFEHYLGPGTKNRHMSLDTAKKAIHLYLSNPHQPESTIILFGGEPMLWWEHIPPLVTYGNARAAECETSIQWRISTNGTYLPEEAIDFFVHNNVYPMITIDGDKETHDTQRSDAHGQGSYDTILANYQALLKKTQSITLRATATPENPHVCTIYQILSDLHPAEIAIFPQYFTVGSSQWDEQTLQILLDEYSLLSEQIYSLIVNGTNQRIQAFPFSVFLYHLCAREHKKGYCGAYGQMIAVSPDGFLYPCITLDGKKSYCIGELSQGLNHQAFERWKDLCRITTRPSCMKCWARNLCGGGCIAHTVLMYGEHAPPAEFECAIIRHLIECSIWLYLEILENKPDYFLSLSPIFQRVVSDIITRER